MSVCVCMYVHVCVCVCVRACVCVFGQHFFINAYFIKQYRHLLSKHFLYVLSSCCIDFMVSVGNWLK